VGDAAAVARPAASSPEDQVVTSDEGPIRVITLNRPQRLNAFTDVGYGMLAAALQAADAAPGVHVVLIEGAGRGFSSGVDLDAFVDGDHASFDRAFGMLIDTLAGFRKPLLAAVGGVAVGFGATLLLHCDLVLVADDARIRFPFTQLGTAPEAGSSWLLPAAVGAQRAADLILTSRWLDGTEAARIGLAARCVPAGELAGAARAVANDIASHPLPAVIAAKQLLKVSTASAVGRASGFERTAAHALSAELGPLRDRRHG
jgi:enoyl-CoA hydratase/carnithine racemase